MFGPGVETPVDDVGEVTLEGATCLSLRLSLDHLALEEGARSRVDAGRGGNHSTIFDSTEEHNRVVIEFFRRHSGTTAPAQPPPKASAK